MERLTSKHFPARKFVPAIASSVPSVARQIRLWPTIRPPLFPDFARSSLESRIAAEARVLGFAACGIAPADAAPRSAARLNAWLAEGCHGDMIWMESRAAQRGSPNACGPKRDRSSCSGMSYAPDDDPLALERIRRAGAFRSMRSGKDYHDVVKKALKSLARWLVAERRTGRPGRRQGVRRYRAGDGKAARRSRRAGLAGQAHQPRQPRPTAAGCSSARSTRRWIWRPTRPGTDLCGSCDACQRACPTDAFPAPYRLDARRCISYLTIEHKGPIPHEFRKAIGNRIYGCDDCLAVCPWNKFADARGGQFAFSAARRTCRAARSPTCSRSTMRAFARCFPDRRSSASGATGWSATARSRRAIAAMPRWYRR